MVCFRVGAVSGGRRRPCQHAARGVGVEHQLGHQLPRVAAEEELAECTFALHQEHNGTAAENLLKTFCGDIDFLLLFG